MSDGNKEELKNLLLSSLGSKELETIEPRLEIVSFQLSEVVHDVGDHLEYVYFPTTSLVSLLYITESGAMSEIGVIGCEGLAGVTCVLGGLTAPNRAIIQNAGEAYRMRTGDLRLAIANSDNFQKILLRFAQALMIQISQTAVCNQLHSLEQQLCRWLLLSDDRIEGNRIHMTHEMISHMIGVRREGVTLALKKLSEMDLVGTARGRIELLDREGLKAVSCECYQVVKDEYDRLQGLNENKRAAF